MADATVRALVLSCREPTRDSGPSSADAEEVPSPRPPASPAGAAISPFDEACRSLGYCLYRTCSRSFVANTFAGLQFYDAAVAAFDLCAIHDPDESSGPPGAVAAKESRDNAAAPEGAAKAESHACNPGERECNCDQALHLERRIGDAVRAIRRSNTIPAGLLHELLGILEGEA
jgi:hypothetical protein